MAGQGTNGVIENIDNTLPLQDVPFLVVGMGPAGASLASFLGSHGWYH